jgi:nucleoside-diphosphate-sugar epimerase
MNILITGSNGFVGSKLMWSLEADGHTVIGLDISSHCDAQTHPETMIGDIRVIKDCKAWR